MSKFIRPGHELATRPLYFYWIVDCSTSMKGEKIDTVNHAMMSVVPEMREEARNTPNIRLLISVLRFSSGASWVTPSPVPIEDFLPDDLTADGVTDMGKAFEMLAAQLTIPPMPERALPPVLVLLSDGQPTDNYRKSLNDLLSLPWGKKSIRIAVSIGPDAKDDVLEEFTGSRELVLQANNASALGRMIKWTSSVASSVSSPRSNPKEQIKHAGSKISSITNAPLMVPMNSIPKAVLSASEDDW